MFVIFHQISGSSSYKIALIKECNPVLLSYFMQGCPMERVNIRVPTLAINTTIIYRNFIRRGYSSGTGSVSPFVIRPYDMRRYACTRFSFDKNTWFQFQPAISYFFRIFSA